MKDNYKNVKKANKSLCLRLKVRKIYSIYLKLFKV